MRTRVKELERLRDRMFILFLVVDLIAILLLLLAL